ncbi:MAG: hypothetical protein LH660_05520 [Phormidesmis sp. CAN_BIN36]|nr:hypothetical protein [Phormidesmis sp. CAN_BIN36]
MLKPQSRQKSLKLLTGMLAIALLFPASVSAESKPSLTQPTYKQNVQSYYQQIEANFKAQEPQRYRKTSQILHALFDSPAVKIPFRTITIIGSRRSITSSGAIYFAQGGIFIVHDALPKAPTERYRFGSEESFATLNGEIYTWKDGSKSGEILKRYPKDTLNFLFYSIEPAGVMRSAYQEYIEAPQNFSVSKRGEVNHLMLKQPQSGFAGVLIRENPFWLSGLVMKSTESEKTTGISEFDPPIPLQSLPEKIKQLPKGVRFTPSPATLERRMVYL